jgi:hypothetical protein
MLIDFKNELKFLYLPLAVLLLISNPKETLREPQAASRGLSV